MRRILWIPFLFVWVLELQAYASEELTPEKKADIAKLLSMTGALSIANVMANMASQQIISAVQSARPDIPPNIFEVIRDETRKVIDGAVSEEGGLIDLMVPIYHRNFSHDEIKGLLSFYSTPLGTKILSTMPTMMQEGMAAGQKWAQQLTPILGERIKERLKEKGINI